MALGLNLSSGGGNYLPICKFDCRAGRMFKSDKVDGSWSQVDITKNFKAVMDLENVEVGWIKFDGGAPDFVMNHISEGLPEKPSDMHRQGVRLVIKLNKSCGGDVRELAGNAKALLAGVDALHDLYEEGIVNNKGKLPVVALADTVAVSTGEGATKSTNYRPVFEITGWVDRPDDLVPSSRPSSSPKVKASAPTTGSTKVFAPKAVIADDDEDFG